MLFYLGSCWAHTSNPGVPGTPKCQQMQMYIFGYLGGPEGVFNDRTGPIFLSSYPLTLSICTCQIRKQSDKNFLSLNPKYEEKTHFFFIFGGPGGGGGPYVEPR